METEHDDEQETTIAGDIPSITDVVAEAADESADNEARNVAYDDALDFFLADENDLEANALTDNVTVWRYDIEAEEDRALVTIPIHTIDDATLKRLRQQSREKGPGGVKTNETDDMRFYTLVCAEAANFDPEKRKQIIAKHRTLEIAFRKMLLPGERTSLAQHILGFSGFGATIQSKASAEIEAAKN